MKLILFLFVFQLSISINTQILCENFSIATDSTINEIELYFTSYWYDAWLYRDYNSVASAKMKEPIWLTYFAILVNKEQLAGNYEVTFKAKNLTSGICFYTLNVGKQRATNKMLLIR